MAARTSISVPAVALAGAGGVAVWAAMKGVSVASGVRTLLGGHTLPPGEDLAVDVAELGVGGSAVGGSADLAASNNPVAAAAMRYLDQGHRYRWAGASPTNGWDCSGWSNYVICHDVGLAIPGYAGGTFTGASHGPVTMQWAVWSGCVNIPRDQVQAGDLIVWPLRHMGIAVDNTTMANCPGPNGTPAPVLGPISGHTSLGPVVYRRLTGRR